MTINRTVAALVVGALAATAPGADTVAEGSAALVDARSTVARWVETEQVISKEKREWQIGKEVLLQRIALVEGEIATMERKIVESREAIAGAAASRGELAERKQQLEAARVALVDAIGPLEQRTRSLLAVLPDPVRQRVEPLSQRMPADASSTDRSLSERFQNVIGILNEVNKFDREIHVTNEIRPLADGTTAEVTALYVGLGQAYYVTPSGHAAGVGRPGAAGWEWLPADHLAPEVARAVAILKSEQVPAFVPLPVEIR